jgi:hypothetical protein
MIPEFDLDGTLPKGIHTATESDFFDRFGASSARRRWLGDRFRELLALAKATGNLERVFVWGSFVTSKESPNDIDLLLVMGTDFEVEEVPQRCRHAFEHASARMTFQADVFWAKSSIGEETLHLWLETYQRTRDFKRCGIIEVLRA